MRAAQIQTRNKAPLCKGHHTCTSKVEVQHAGINRATSEYATTKCFLAIMLGAVRTCL